MDRKSAKAEAKAAKARAKALRPWYKKKRVIFPGAIVVVVIIIVAATAGSKKTPSSTSPSSGVTSVAAGCAKTHASYPAEQPTHDCVALPNHTVAIANTTVTATWTSKAGALGGTDICTAVSIKNHNSSTISYNPLYWNLQTPSGTVENTDITGTLSSGSLIAGGTVAGTVCFADPGQSGTYVGIYKPDAFSADRGIWLFTP